MAPKHEFPGVTVTVRDQIDKGPVNVRTEQLGGKASMPSEPHFTVIRPVINIVLSKDTPINPPVVLRIRITAEDISSAGGKSIKLAYWDKKRGPNSRWVILTDNFKLDPDPLPASGGYAEVDFSKRGDPPIAVGT